MSDKAIETKVKETTDENGKVVERIVETWMEKVPMELKSRKIEKISYTPVVTEFIENYEDGQPVALTASETAAQPKGLSDMKTRVMASGKMVADIMFYVVIVGLAIAIVYKVWF